MTPKLARVLNFLLRTFIALGALAFIIARIPEAGVWNEFAGIFVNHFSLATTYNHLAVLILLMILNWSLETVKWMMLVECLEKTGFLKALKGVLSGITVSLFTPNRTGEFIGRAFMLQKANPVDAALLNVAGSFSQLMITFILGSISLVFFLPVMQVQLSDFPTWINTTVISGIVFANLVMLLLYFNLPVIKYLPGKKLTGRIPQLTRYLGIYSYISTELLFKILAISLLRYILFCTQFYLALRLFDISIQAYDALYLLPVIYLALATIPTFALTELGIRGSVSIFVIGGFMAHYSGIPTTGTQNISIVMAAFFIWVINLAIPAIAGLPFVFRLKFFR